MFADLFYYDDPDDKQSGEGEGLDTITSFSGETEEALAADEFDDDMQFSLEGSKIDAEAIKIGRAAQETGFLPSDIDVEDAFGIEGLSDEDYLEDYE